MNKELKKTEDTSSNNTAKPPVAPKTQDNTNINILIFGLAFSLVAIAGLTIKRKKSKEIM